MTNNRLIYCPLIFLITLVGCGGRSGTSNGIGDTPAGNITRTMPAYPDRPYVVHFPGGLVPLQPSPVVLVLHGGGSKAEGARTMTCPDKNTSSSNCIEAVADRNGFVAVFPNGTRTTTGLLAMGDSRTWNAGGGVGGWGCVSGEACNTGVDDIQYFKDLLDDLPSVFPVNPKHVFATGLSNGAAMSHRLACELAGRIAAIAPVGGGNQFSTSVTCTPGRPVAVLSIHGTEDNCWMYEEGIGTCLVTDSRLKIGIPQTVQDWATRNGCTGSGTMVIALPDTDPNDGTRTYEESYTPCSGGVVVTLLRVEGGGHWWPGGDDYRVPLVTLDGKISKDFSASDRIWNFFVAHPMS